MKRICAVFLCLLLVASLSTTANAVNSVTYSGRAKDFIFTPGSKDSPTDLFSDFKNVMPGDTITQQIEIRNAAYEKVKIKLFMRSLGAQEDTDDFLSSLNLTVAQEDDSILFDAPADETEDLTEWVYLGTVYSGGKVTLNVTLDVPITLENKYQNQIGYIDWQFKIEELPVSPSDPSSPKTGDTSNITVYFGLLICSLAALMYLLFAGMRKKSRKA